MHITIINDCYDENAKARQLMRVGTLFPEASVSLDGVGDYADLAAAGNVIDVLDASAGKSAAVLVNVAPRHKTGLQDGKKWPNGTPFSYFWYKKTLVVATIDGLTLSLIKKLALTESVQVMDIPTVAPVLVEAGIIDTAHATYLGRTQFRSFDFVPFVARALCDGVAIPAEALSLNDIPDAPETVWWVDNFGNCKTTLLPEDIAFETGKVVSLAGHSLTCFAHLKDVPYDQAAIIVGSSGFGPHRFLELVVQGRRAAQELALSPGTPLT